MKVKKLIAMLQKVDGEKNIKLLEGDDSELVDMFGISIQMEDEGLEGQDIVFCSEETFDAFLDQTE